MLSEEHGQLSLGYTPQGCFHDPFSWLVTQTVLVTSKVWMEMTHSRELVAPFLSEQMYFVTRWASSGKWDGSLAFHPFCS